MSDDKTHSQLAQQGGDRDRSIEPARSLTQLPRPLPVATVHTHGDVEHRQILIDTALANLEKAIDAYLDSEGLSKEANIDDLIRVARKLA